MNQHSRNKPAGRPARRNAISLGLVQMEIFPGNPARNAGHMLEEIGRARAAGLDLLVFPEMAVPGYLMGDMWEREGFLRDCEYWSGRIAAATAGEKGPIVVWGTVVTEWEERGEDGRPRKYNGYMVARDGRQLMHPALQKPYGIKTLLPNYREFEEPRYFYDTRRLALERGITWDSLMEPFELEPGREGEAGLRAGIVLCEDAWDEDYAQKPLAALGEKGCDLVLNLSCSPYTLGKNGKRNRLFAAQAAKLGCPLLYVNAVSLQNNGKTVYAFDGSSTLYDGRGRIRLELEAFRAQTRALRLEIEGADLVVKDLGAGRGGRHMVPPWPRPGQDMSARPPGPGGPPRPGPAGSSSQAKPTAPSRAGAIGSPESMEEICAALRFGARRFLAAAAADKVVIGVSGGIDSAVNAALYASILPREKILLVSMPSRYNSPTTRALARELARNLGCLFAEIPIEDSVALTRSQVDGLKAASPDGAHERVLRLEDFHLENVQARDRSSRILAACAAAFGGVFTCNANKAEMTVGYTTLYGDLAGYLCLLGDLWKEDVYALGRYLNAKVYGREAIPRGIFEVVPSAELSPRQAVDVGRGDPLVYPYHDRLFHSWVQRWRRATPEENLEWYLEGTLNENLQCPLDAYRLFPDAASFIADLEKWWNLYNGMGVAKRIQAPPVLAVSSRAYGFDHREHQGPPFYSQRYREMRLKALAGEGKGGT